MFQLSFIAQRVKTTNEATCCKQKQEFSLWRKKNKNNKFNNLNAHNSLLKIFQLIAFYNSNNDTHIYIYFKRNYLKRKDELLDSIWLTSVATTYITTETKTNNKKTSYKNELHVVDNQVHHGAIQLGLCRQRKGNTANNKTSYSE